MGPDSSPPDMPKELKSFGAFAGDLGIRMVDWRLDHCELALDIEPRHLNGLGVVHGGVVSTLVDVACAHAGIYCTVPGNRRSGMTASLTVNLMGSAKSGTLRVVARRRGGGKTLYMSSAEVFGEDGALLATGESVCRYRRGSHLPEGVPPAEP